MGHPTSSHEGLGLGLLSGLHSYVARVLYGITLPVLSFFLLFLIMCICHDSFRLDWLLSIILIHLVVRLTRNFIGLWMAPLVTSMGFLFYGELHQGRTVCCSQVGELDRQLGVLQDTVG